MMVTKVNLSEEVIDTLNYIQANKADLLDDLIFIENFVIDTVPECDQVKPSEVLDIIRLLRHFKMQVNRLCPEKE